jgi:RNA ligase
MSGRRFEGRAPTLEEALDLARRHKSLAVRRKDGLALFTYLWADPELFADPRAREFRGIIYEEATGETISRPFHKFFNYREPGLGLGPEAFTGPVFVAEKVDGYLLQVFLHQRRLRFASRHSLEAPTVWKLAQQLWTRDHTLAALDLLGGAPRTFLFEVVHPSAPVLVPYERPRLVLLAARSVYTGKYLFPNVDFRWPLEAVKWKLVEGFDPEAFRQEALGGPGEGWVVYLRHLNDFVKFKTAWAFRLASFLKAPEKGFMAALLEDRLDDLRAALADRPDLLKAVGKAEALLEGVLERAAQIIQGLRGAERARVWQAVNEAAGAYPGALRGLFAYTAMGLYTPATAPATGPEEGRAVFMKGLERYRKDVEKALEAMRIFPRVAEVRG